MKSMRLWACLAGLLGWAGMSAAEDWPAWRGPNRDGLSTEKGLLKSWPAGGPKMGWKFEKSGMGYGGVAIAKGRIYLLGSEVPDLTKQPEAGKGKKGGGAPGDGSKEFLLCLDEKTGKQIWKTELKTGPGSYATGWGSGPRSTPTVDGDSVHVLGAKGDLLCVKTDGKTVWHKNLKSDFGGSIPQWGYSESPLVDGEHLVVTPGGNKGAVVKLNKKDGSLVWACKDLTDGAGYSSIIAAEVDGVKQYIQQTMASVAGIRAKDGKLLWKHSDLGYRTAVIPTPIFHDNHVFVTAGYGAGCELVKLAKKGTDETQSEKVYVSKNLINHHGGVIRLDGHVYGHSDSNRGEWVCLDMKTGEPAWTEGRALEKGSIAYADGMFYCYGQRAGKCILIEATTKGWTPKGSMNLPDTTKIPRGQGEIWTHPVIANKRLYLRDHDLLFAFDVAGAAN